MSIARIILITLLISLGIVVLALFNLESDSTTQDGDDPAVASGRPAAKPEKPAATAATPPPPPSDEDLLAPDEMVDDEQVEKEQIAEAMAQLNNSNQEERVEAVEQLGAYPNPETEATLGQLLTTDASPEVRNAAALSLGSLDEPTEATVAALMAALEDQNEDVRFSSLSTLEDYLLGQEEDSPNYRRIKDGLRLKAGSRSVPDELKESINEVLRDQESMAVPEAVPEAEPDN
jgi:hypothetical protein